MILSCFIFTMEFVFAYTWNILWVFVAERLIQYFAEIIKLDWYHANYEHVIVC